MNILKIYNQKINILKLKLKTLNSKIIKLKLYSFKFSFYIVLFSISKLN